MSSVLRVMVLSHIREISGAEIVTLNLFRGNPALSAVYVGPEGAYADAFRKDGHAVEPAEELLHHRIADEGALWYPMFPFRLWRATGKIRQAVAQHRPDVLLAIQAYDLLFLWGLSGGSIPPVVWVCHDTFPPGQSRIGPWVAPISQRAQRIIAVSNAVKARLTELGVAADRVTVMHNGIDAQDRFNPSRVKPADLAPGAAFIGRLFPNKGAHVVLEAVRHVTGAKLYVVGGTWPGFEPYVEELKTQARTLNVEFLGARSDMPAVLAAVDPVFVPSLYPDPLPTVVLEAMAMERTVIGSAIGGIGEMIEHGRTGYLVPPGDSRELARAWADVLSGALPRTGKAARDNVLRSFEFASWQARMTELLRA